MRRNYILIYLIPVIVHLMFLPFWLLDIPSASSAGVSLIELLLGTLVIPIYLIIISYKYLNKVSIGKFLYFLLLMISLTLLGHIISYFNWGISTGNLWNPDSETVHIIMMQITTSLIIIILGWIIACLIKNKRWKQ